MEQDYLEKRAKELKERFEKYYKEKEDLKIHFLNDGQLDHQNIKNIEKDMKYPMKSGYTQSVRARKENDTDVDDDYPLPSKRIKKSEDNDLELVYNRWQKQPQNDEEQKQMEKEINEAKQKIMILNWYIIAGKNSKR